MNAKQILACAVVVAAGAAGLLIAGPLNPPAGPIEASFKTLTDVEPRIAISQDNTPGSGTSVFQITQPGSYYLTGNVQVPPSKNGILINASRVTIDLNGFSVQGAANSADGITFVGSAVQITVKNGSISTCGQAGIDLSGAPLSRVSNVTAYGNKYYGIAVSNASQVEDCIATNNVAGGFVSDGGATFTRCSAFWNKNGFVGDVSDLFDTCRAESNTGIGIYLGNDSRVSHCTVTGNTAQGIICAADDWVTGCTVHSNGGANSAGIWVLDTFNHIEDNDVVNNGFGIFVSGTTNFIYRNKVGSSTQFNFSIAAGNHVGTIGIASANVGLITGNSGGGMGALEADPNANLVY